MSKKYYIFIFLIAFIVSFTISSYTNKEQNNVYIKTPATPKLIIQPSPNKELILEEIKLPAQINKVEDKTENKIYTVDKNLYNKTFKKNSNLFQDIVFIVIIIISSILIFGIVYFLAPILIKKFTTQSDQTDKIIDTISISDNKSIQLVEKDNKILVYELNNNNRKFLTEIKDLNLISTLKSPKYKGKGSLFLTEYLKKYLLFPDNLEEHIIKSKKIDYTINDDLTKDLTFSIDLKNTKFHKITPTPPKNLISKLENAMNKFIQNNPDNDLAAKLATKSNVKDINSELPSYIKTEDKRVGTDLGYNQIENVLSKILEQQNKKLEMIKQGKTKIERENKLINNALTKKQEIEDALFEIGNEIKSIDINTNENIDIKLNKIFNNLTELENNTLKLITDTSVIQNLIREKNNINTLKQFFNSIPEIFEQIEIYNKELINIKQAREVIERERQRKELLLKRKQELEESITNIKNAIAQIEKINQEIRMLDPTSPLETVPISIQNELKRLELELQTINSDPSLNT